MSKSNDTKKFSNKDLLLRVSPSVDRNKWDEGKYEAFLDALCIDGREYQKEAIRISMRYLLGGEYVNLRELARKNFNTNDKLKEKYGTFQGMEKTLQLPEQLSASLDLATGTGKSYVMYGIAAIMLAEGAVDRVLVLAPSKTIKAGLSEKFKELASNAELRELLPADSVTNAPKIIRADESIIAGSICIENYHAILKHVKSSIRDSLIGKGQKTLILNDEAHHVANESDTNTKKWKEFLTDESFGFEKIIGVSGTCYNGKEYFSDVIYRYSLREAMEQRFVKKVRYVDDGPRLKGDKKWKLIFNNHEEIVKQLRSRKIKPLSIVITKDISRCKNVADEFKHFLKENTELSKEQVDEKVLVIHSDAPDLPKLAAVDSPHNKVEWIFSVSMLNEGWDVKRVFQIIPHEEKAFNSRLLIAQVLGRGLRVPENMRQGEQPVVTVFNHDKWADKIRHLVDEIMESEKRLPSFPISKSVLNFDLLNIRYRPKPYTKVHEMKKPYSLFEKGYIVLPMQKEIEDIAVEFEEADTRKHQQWKTKIKNKTYAVNEMAQVMLQRFEDVPDDSDRKYYLKQFPLDKLEEIITKSLKKSNNKVITGELRQRFLQSLGTLRRNAATVVRYDFEPTEYFVVSTKERQQESVSASSMRGGGNKTYFYTEKTKETLPDEYVEFYEEVTEKGSGYKGFQVENYHDFKTPLNAVISDHDNERRFVMQLIDPANVSSIKAWIKSTAMNFYPIDYYWKKGEHPKKGSFNPDFFVEIGNLISVIEIKDDDEIKDPSPENIKKKEYADEHFEKVNKYLKDRKEKMVYKFNFLTPSDFGNYFQSIQDGSIKDFRSQLDVELDSKK